MLKPTEPPIDRVREGAWRMTTAARGQMSWGNRAKTTNHSLEKILFVAFV
jgi:hypothetical protein